MKERKEYELEEESIPEGASEVRAERLPVQHDVARVSHDRWLRWRRDWVHSCGPDVPLWPELTVQSMLSSLKVSQIFSRLSSAQRSKRCNPTPSAIVMHVFMDVDFNLSS